MTPLLALLLLLPPQDVPAGKRPPAAEGPAESRPDPQKARKEFEVGEFYLRKKSYAASAARFDRATQFNPKFADAWLRLGQAREGTGELQKAVEAYQKFLELDPKNKKARDAQKAIARLKEELK